MKLKIAIAVHGRFHAFGLAKALIDKGNEVTLLTNYPKYAVERFGVPRARVRSFALHGIISKAANRLRFRGKPLNFERYLHTIFSRWARQRLVQISPDVIYSWSGVSEEILRSKELSSSIRLLVRGSAHIRKQFELLRDEELRTGVSQERPNSWIIEREEREYGLADAVVVLSSFCRDTFLEKGFSKDRIRLMVSGINIESFRPESGVVEDRRGRILSGAPLRVLNVGTLSFRKGVWDLAKIIDSVPNSKFHFKFVGSVSPEAARLASSLSGKAEFVSRIPQWELPKQYEWADLFVLPTIEDGFPGVLAQAAAAGLPILTTPNGAGHDLVRHGVSGWVLPVRSPDAFIEQLQWCDSNRIQLAEMVKGVYKTFRQRDWADVAEDFIEICTDMRSRRKRT